MIKLYIKDNDTIEDSSGMLVTQVRASACSARDGRIDEHLRAAMRRHGIRPALREDVIGVTPDGRLIPLF